MKIFKMFLSFHHKNYFEIKKNQMLKTSKNFIELLKKKFLQFRQHIQKI
jgi:hypothetical protein